MRIWKKTPNVYLEEDWYSAKIIENRILYFEYFYCKILHLLLVTDSCNTNFLHLFGVGTTLTCSKVDEWIFSNHILFCIQAWTSYTTLRMVTFGDWVVVYILNLVGGYKYKMSISQF